MAVGISAFRFHSKSTKLILHDLDIHKNYKVNVRNVDVKIKQIVTI